MNKSAVAAERSRVAPGPEHITALFNLARFHEALAASYGRRADYEQSAEGGSARIRHIKEAAAAFRGIMRHSPADAPEHGVDARMLAELDATQ